MKLLRKKLPCGAVIQQVQEQTKGFIRLSIESYDGSFASVSGLEENDSSAWRPKLQLVLYRKNLRAIRAFVDKLLKQKVK